MSLDVAISYEGYRKLDPLADVSPSHLLQVISGQASRTVTIDISRSALVPLRHRLASRTDNTRPDPVLLTGLRRLERIISSATPLEELANVRFLSADVDEIVEFIQEPSQCEWQARVGRTYSCNAAADLKARATTPADCAKCMVPDARWICTNFVHPVIRNVGVMGDPPARMLFDARCNLGNDCAGEGCQPGGSSCWSRAVTPVAASRSQLPMKLSGQQVPKVFICHASEDKPSARMVAEALRHMGARVWLDEWEIKVGESIVQKVTSGLEGSSHLVLLLSQHSVNKPWVRREFSAALMRQLSDGGVTVLPVKLDSASPPAIIADLRYADGSVDLENALRELREVLFPE